MTQGTFLTLERTYVAIDLETTGLQPETDGIVEVGAVLFEEDRVLETFNRLVYPGRRLSQFVSLLTGIKDADIAGAPRFDEIADELRAFIGDHTIVGQNVSFDLAFLAANNLRPKGPVLDTRSISRIVRPAAFQHGLDALVDAFGIVNESPHRALADADATRRVFLALRSAIRELTDETVAVGSALSLAAGNAWAEGALFEEEAANRQLPPGAGGGAIAAAVKRTTALAGPVGQRHQPGASTFEPDGIQRLFEPGGAVERAVEEYEPRSQQVQMATKVAETLHRGGTLLAEAPPGAGKSIAYLVPAIGFAAASGLPVVVSTSTRGLQEQLADKDLPQALKVFGLDTERFSTTVLKGRGNYLCLSRLTQELMRPDVGGDRAAFLARVTVWLESTERGDIGELALFDNEREFWPPISAGGADEHTDCDYQRRGICFPARARKAAQDAGLIITNHSLLLADSARTGAVLGHAKHLIIDEAHHLEREATAQFSRNVTRRDLEELLNALGARDGRPRFVPSAMGEAASTGASARTAEIGSRGAIVGERAGAASTAMQALFDVVGPFVARETGQPEGDGVVRVTEGTRQSQGWAPIGEAWTAVHATLSALRVSVDALADAMEGVVVGYLQGTIEDLSRRLADVRQVFELVSSGDSKNGIVWLTASRGTRETVLGFHWAPLTVAPILASDLLNDRDSVVLTSGTLTAEGSFRYVRSRLGVEQSADELRLDSPFDGSEAVSAFIPNDMPSPDSPGYRRAVEQAVAQIAAISEGGVLVLFTSYAALKQAYEYLRAELASQDISVLGQGIDGAAGRLIEMQRSNPRTVLLGAATFWEGVDLAGDALRVLVIPRLPFAVPTDPIVAGRGETYEDPFGEFTLPESLLRFRQGLGRLIRTRTDQGAIVVLDSRVLNRAYGKAFLDALPTPTVAKPPLSNLPDAVGDWLYDRRVRV